MAREFTQPWSYVTAPISNIPGADGQAQQPQVIIPPGYGSYQDPMSSAIDSMAEGFMNYAAQQKAQKQYQEAVKGIGEFWPILQATGVSEGQVNAMLKSGMEPKDVVHYALTQQANRSMKGLEWGREDYTHARDLSESAFTPDQLDIVESFKSGKISLPDAMRQSGLSSKQLKSAMEEATSGEGLLQKPFETEKKGLDISEAKSRLKKTDLEIKELQKRIDNTRTPEEKSDLEEQRQEKLHEHNRLFDIAHPEEKTGGKGLPTNLQTQANNIQGLASARAMYASMLKLGYKDVRPPNMAQKDPAGFDVGKNESKDSYFKDVVLPRLQNAKNTTTSDPTPTSTPPTSTYKFPKNPYGVAAPKIAKMSGIDPDIFGRLIQQESGWNNNARSSVGAIGYGQLMPETAKALKINPHDPYQNLAGSARYLKGLLDQFGGDYSLALAAYNAGPNAVRKYGGIPPFKETQAYVKAILGTDNAQPTSTKRKSLDEIF